MNTAADKPEVETEVETPVDKTKISLSNGTELELTPEQLRDVAKDAFELELSRGSKGEQTSKPEAKTLDKEAKANDVAELKESLEALQERLDNDKRQAEIKANNDKISAQLSDAFDKYPNVRANDALKEVVESAALAKKFRSPKKNMVDIVDEIVSAMTDGKVAGNEDYIRSKRDTANKTRTTSGLGSSTSTAEVEEPKFTAKDLLSGKVRRATKQRIKSNFEA